MQVMGRSVSLGRQTTMFTVCMKNFVSLRALADVCPPERSASFRCLIPPSLRRAPADSQSSQQSRVAGVA